MNLSVSKCVKPSWWELDQSKISTFPPQKLANISLRIQQIDTTLCILEAKVSCHTLFKLSWMSFLFLTNVFVVVFCLCGAVGLHSRAGGGHSRWTEPAAQCADKWAHSNQSNPNRWVFSGSSSFLSGECSDLL